MISNIPGVELPATGGPGTRKLLAAGITLILLTAAGMILKTCRGRPAPTREAGRSGPHDCRHALFDRRIRPPIGKGRIERPPKDGGADG